MGGTLTVAAYDALTALVAVVLMNACAALVAVGLRKPWHDLGMSDLERRTGSRPSRQKREQRAYNLVLVGGAAGLVFVVGTLLAILGITGWSIAVVAAIVAVVCALLFRRTVS
jgi:hypothetical protein